MLFRHDCQVKAHTRGLLRLFPLSPIGTYIVTFQSFPFPSLILCYSPSQFRLNLRSSRTICLSLQSYISALSSHSFIMTLKHYSTLYREWDGIDAHRLNKFLTLIRRVWRSSLLFLKKQNWDSTLVRYQKGWIPFSYIC